MRVLQRARNALSYAAGTRAPVVGATPKEVVWRRDKAQLWRYRSDRIRFQTPVVLVHSLVSRSLILDLRPGNSMIEALRDAGFDVYLVDWGVPDELDAANTLETYVDEYLPRAIAAACRVSGAREVTLAGYCLGGVLTALFAAARPGPPVRNLVTIATPIDLSGMGALVALIREGRLGAADLVDETGNVPADFLLAGFRMLVPTDRVVQYVNLWQRLDDEEFVAGHRAMAAWAHQHIPFPGAAFAQIVEQLVRHDGLVEGDLRLGQRVVDLAAIRCPVLNVLAEADTVVPVPCTAPLAGLVGGADVEELRVPAGHVALVVGGKAQRITFPALAAWIGRRSAPRQGPASAISLATSS
jgi:poly[(R)-3-hydroxyalkanoate] polymerase subunit PhaC